MLIVFNFLLSLLVQFLRLYFCRDCYDCKLNARDILWLILFYLPPIILTSGSNFTLNLSNTTFCTCSITATTSEHFASPTLTMNPQCFSLIIASLYLYPLSPASSINCPAKCPSGLLNTEPHEGSSNGCFDVLLSV